MCFKKKNNKRKSIDWNFSSITLNIPQEAMEWLSEKQDKEDEIRRQKDKMRTKGVI